MLLVIDFCKVRLFYYWIKIILLSYLYLVFNYYWDSYDDYSLVFIALIYYCRYANFVIYTVYIVVFWYYKCGEIVFVFISYFMCIS
jgi:hypothetical protein